MLKSILSIKAGIVYGSSSGYTENIAYRLGQLWGIRKDDIHGIDEIDANWFQAFDLLFLGTSTWGIGEIQENWNDFVQGSTIVNARGKYAALFGLGDQGSYPDSFADGLAVLYNWADSCGFNVIGKWSVQGYNFAESRAAENGYFPGLVLDEKNQPEYSDIRMMQWIEIIKVQINKIT